jgi:hypothetical protein
MIEGRLVLEKIDTLESKMRYQIEKLVRVADAPARSTSTVEGMYSQNNLLYIVLIYITKIHLRSSQTHKRS